MKFLSRLGGHSVCFFWNIESDTYAYIFTGRFMPRPCSSAVTDVSQRFDLASQGLPTYPLYESDILLTLVDLISYK